MTQASHHADNQPLTQDELVLRDNQPATEKMPAEVASMLGSHRLSVTYPGDMPALERPAKAAGGPDAHRLILPSTAFVGMAGKTASHLTPSTAPGRSTAEHSTAAHRPMWSEHVYHPRRSVSPPWTRTTTRKKGGFGELHYGVYPPDDRAVYYPSG